MQFETSRLILRPLSKNDTRDVAKVVFSDPNVVGMLAHDTREPEDAMREAARWTSIMGIDGDGGIWEDGGLGLFAIVPKNNNTDFAGVAGFYMERNDSGRWNGEYFYALGTPWHGQGLMSEVADVFAKELAAMPDLGVIYAGYWDMINEASGRVLRRTGLMPKGRKAVTQEYDTERCLKMFDYDMWRLEQSRETEQHKRTLVQACRRAGAFIAENIIEHDDGVKNLLQAYGGSRLTPEAAQMLERAIAAPGLAYVEIRGANETAEPVNRLR